MSQSSSSRQKAFYYAQSAMLSSQELETLQNIQGSLIAGKKLRDLLNNPGMIDGYIDELKKMNDRLENLKTEEAPKDLTLSIDDSFATSIETIRTDIWEAIKLFILAVENTEEIKRIQRDGQVAEKDARDINMNKSLFIDNIERCRQLLNEAEKIATNLRVVDTISQNPNAKAG